MRVPIVVVALCLVPAVAHSQSLGEASRRQSRQRAARPEAAKVYTDVDLRSPAEPGTQESPPLSATVAEEETPPAGAAAASDATAETEDAVRARLDREAEERKRRETEWRERARGARARIDSARHEYVVACGPGVLLLAGG